MFLAAEKHTENKVAIKQLKNKDISRQEGIIYEMQMVSKFNHPHIVMYKHHFVQDDMLYLVMEYCPLGSLRHIMQVDVDSNADIWKWMSELTATLQLVHEKGIIHHDIKPDNILFSEDRTIKVTDFGIANTGGGTRPYMSPEALSRESNIVKDPRVDVYALGVTLMEFLIKQNPFFWKISR